MMKTILITGAAKRIGASLALKFAAMNWNILIHYNNSEIEAKQLLEKINSANFTLNSKNNCSENNDNTNKNDDFSKNYTGIAKIFKADLRNENEIINLFDFASKEFAQIDVLVNNAAIFPEKKMFSDIDSIFWDDVFATNLRSQFLTSREFSNTVKEKIKENPNSNTNFKIINFSSLGGLKIWDKKIPYNISKSAVIQLTKALARELAPQISVNCICPGIVKIDEREEIFISESKIPMQRYATVEDIFELVYFFATSTNYITGQVVTVDGGMEFV